MKKLTALLLALAMILALAACGGGNAAPAVEQPAAEAPAEEAAEPAAEAPVEEATEPAAEEPAAEAGTEYPVVTLNVNCSYNESETTGQQLKYFADYIAEKSGGNVTMNIYWGGTFASSQEELEYVSNGSVDMCMLSVAQYAADLPLSNFPAMGNGSQENVVKAVEYILFENPETSAIIDEELSAHNIKFLAVNAGGTNAFCGKEPMENYEGFAGKILGVMMNQSMYAELGATPYFSLPPETYSDLQKGVVDTAAISLAGIVGLAWYEVAPYVVIDGQYSCSNYYTINLDKWNSLDPAVQALLQEGADAARDHSFELNDGELQACIDKIDSFNAEKGIDAKVVYQDDEHAQTEFEVYMKNAFADCRVSAENAGKSEQMETILTALADYYGLEQ